MQKFVKPLSLRQQQVLDYRSQGVSFEVIADHLGCSLRAAIEYHRRALGKLQRTNDFALAPLEQAESYARSPRKTPAKPVVFSSSYLDVRTCPINIVKISETLQSLERKHRTNSTPDQSKVLDGDESAKGWDFVGRSHSPQTTIIDPPRHPFANPLAVALDRRGWALA